MSIDTTDDQGWAGDEFARDDRCYCPGCQTQGLISCTDVYARQG